MLPGNRRPRRRGQNARLAGGCPSTPRSRLPGSPDVAETGGDGRGVTAGSGRRRPRSAVVPRRGCSVRLLWARRLPVAPWSAWRAWPEVGRWPGAACSAWRARPEVGRWPGRPARLGGRGRRLAVGLGRLFRVGGRRGRGRPMPRHQLGRHGQRGPWGLETRMGLAPRRVVSPVRVRVSPLEVRKIFVTASVRRARRGA